MDINTRDFGTVQVNEDAVYAFPDGLYGFEENKSFSIFSQAFDEVDFLYLQATDSLDPCFLVFEPWDLYDNYAPHVSPEDLKSLDVTSVDDLIFLATGSFANKEAGLSLNLKSPIVLNPKTRQAKQVILLNQDYPLRFYPFEANGVSEEVSQVSD